jgi:hypothetical protein
MAGKDLRDGAALVEGHAKGHLPRQRVRHAQQVDVRPRGNLRIPMLHAACSRMFAASRRSGESDRLCMTRPIRSSGNFREDRGEQPANSMRSQPSSTSHLTARPRSFSPQSTGTVSMK